MAEGLVEGALGGEDEKPESEAPESQARAEAFASAVAARLSANDPEVARKTAEFLTDQSSADISKRSMHSGCTCLRGRREKSISVDWACDCESVFNCSCFLDASFGAARNGSDPPPTHPCDCSARLTRTLLSTPMSACVS
jgi:hypothetical protein